MRFKDFVDLQLQCLKHLIKPSRLKSYESQIEKHVTLQNHTAAVRFILLAENV